MKNKYNKLIRCFSTLFLMLSLMFVTPINFAFAANNGTFTDFTDSLNPTPKTVENVQSTCSAPTAVKDSLIMSIVTICIPGILEKVKEWKEMQCEAAVCKYGAIKAGIDPSFCDKQKEYKFCKFIWGEIFVVPPLSIIEMYKDMIKELLANPVGILYGIATKVARNFLNTCTGSCTGPVVAATASFVFVVDLTATIQRIKDIMEYGFDGNKIEQNFCEQAREIKTELEEIVNAYETLQSAGGAY